MNKRAIAEYDVPEYTVLEEVTIGEKEKKTGLKVEVKWQQEEKNVIRWNHVTKTR